MLIVLEGIDGSGKGTQAALLVESLRAKGLTVSPFSFPRYNTGPFSQAIADYLNGKYGSLSTVPPQLAALLYAGDRFAAKAELDEAVRSHDVVVCDRYAASNLAHQGSRLPDDQRPEFIRWLSDIEYTVYAIPRADLTLLLDIPVDIASALVLKKKPRGYTEAAADLHERDSEYLFRSHLVYQHLAKHHIGGTWRKISCCDNSGGLRNQSTIQTEIAETVMSLFATT